MKTEKPLPGIASSVNRFVLHHNAVNRAWRNTEFTAGAFVCDHGVHLFHRAKDGIDRAGLDAQSAAYARLLTNDCNCSRFFHSIFGVQGQGLPPQQASQGADSSFAARRALVDFSGRLRSLRRDDILEIAFPHRFAEAPSMRSANRLLRPDSSQPIRCQVRNLLDQADAKNCKDHQPGLVTGGATFTLHACPQWRLNQVRV
jgi:hypothetical protein